jgi:hypothetical protein
MTRDAVRPPSPAGRHSRGHVRLDDRFVSVRVVLEVVRGDHDESRIAGRGVATRAPMRHCGQRYESTVGAEIVIVTASTGDFGLRVAI